MGACKSTQAKPSTSSAETQTRRYSVVLEDINSPTEIPAQPSQFLTTLRERANPVHRIVLTGGPCAGKSTMLSVLQQKLPQRTGVKVLCVPEAATLLMTGGLTWDNMTEEKVIEYQLALLKTQIALEDNFMKIAVASGQPCLIVCDRGTMDGRAYSSDEQFAEITKRGGYTTEILRDERYDAVIHMVTAAIGAEKHYNYDNPVRFETVEEAKKADEHLRKMYIGHPMLRVFDNSTPFEKKIDRILDFVCDTIGCSHPHHRVRRYLVTDIPKKLPIESAHVTVTQTILNHSTDDNVMMVMKREQGSSTVFFYQAVRRCQTDRSPMQKHADPCANGVTDSPDSDSPDASPRMNGSIDPLEASMVSQQTEVVREEHRISAKEYQSLVSQRDPSRCDVVKDNRSFVYGDHYCELAEFRSPEWATGKAVMYVDCEKSEPELPPFVPIARDMKTDKSLSAFMVSVQPPKS